MGVYFVELDLAELNYFIGQANYSASTSTVKSNKYSSGQVFITFFKI